MTIFALLQYCSATLRLDYLYPLSKRLTDPLRTDGKEGVEEVVELMEEYGISQEDYDTSLELTKFKVRPLSRSNFRVC
jgi:hypothetical protein